MSAKITPIYHITHLDNLSSILQAKGLQAKKQIGVNHINIAHSNLQERRATTRVPCGLDGSIHDYVPFYFAPRSPMLYSIHRGNVEGYAQGQEPVVYLVSTIQEVAATQQYFAFTDGHPVVFPSCFYENLAELNKIDWIIMKARYWADVPEDQDRKRRRQAEFLVHSFFSWQWIKEIGVINQTMEKQVQEVLQKHSINTTLSIHPEWYY